VREPGTKKPSSVAGLFSSVTPVLRARAMSYPAGVVGNGRRAREVMPAAM